MTVVGHLPSTHPSTNKISQALAWPNQRTGHTVSHENHVLNNLPDPTVSPHSQATLQTLTQVLFLCFSKGARQRIKKPWQETFSVELMLRLEMPFSQVKVCSSVDCPLLSQGSRQWVGPLVLKPRASFPHHLPRTVFTSRVLEALLRSRIPLCLSVAGMG